jgi:5-methylcytosine-specific restriction endonuclease McrA
VVRRYVLLEHRGRIRELRYQGALYSRQRQSKRELEHAHAVLAASTSPAKRKREPIPKDVRHTVWARDEGCCAECDSDFDIQYDHIIPFSMGGASTVENLQLLCARGNQTKGGRL